VRGLERFVQLGKSMSNRNFVAVLACAVAACQPSASADATPAPPANSRARPARDAQLPPAQRFERDMMVRFHMLASYDTTRTIERLLIRGQLDEARYFAQSLATEADVPGTAPWARQIEHVREAAAAVATAPDIAEACRRAARLADACASCHRDAGAQAEFQPPHNVPPDLPTVVARMARHRWATERLREGMIGDTEDAWRAGLDILASEPLAALGSDRKALAARLQQLADQARHLPRPTPADRASVYGELLVTCASCHVGPARASGLAR